MAGKVDSKRLIIVSNHCQLHSIAKLGKFHGNSCDKSLVSQVDKEQANSNSKWATVSGNFGLIVIFSSAGKIIHTPVL